MSQFDRPPAGGVPRNSLPATENGVCSPLSGPATTPGLPEFVEPRTVNSRKLRSRCLDLVSAGHSFSDGRPRDSRSWAKKRLPVRQNSIQAHLNYVSADVKLRPNVSSSCGALFALARRFSRGPMPRILTMLEARSPSGVRRKPDPEEPGRDRASLGAGPELNLS